LLFHGIGWKWACNVCKKMQPMTEFILMHIYPGSHLDKLCVACNRCINVALCVKFSGGVLDCSCPFGCGTPIPLMRLQPCAIDFYDYCKMKLVHGDFIARCPYPGCCSYGLVVEGDYAVCMRKHRFCPACKHPISRRHKCKRLGILSI
jgi:hypothetical protein